MWSSPLDNPLLQRHQTNLTLDSGFLISSSFRRPLEHFLYLPLRRACHPGTGLLAVLLSTKGIATSLFAIRKVGLVESSGRPSLWSNLPHLFGNPSLSEKQKKLIEQCWQYRS